MTLTKTLTASTYLKVNDRLDVRGKHRIAQVLLREDNVLVKVTTRGARTATLRRFDREQIVTVYRPERAA